MQLPTRLPSFDLKLDRAFGRGNAPVTGLDIQPGFIAAVEGRVNGFVVADKAAVMALEADTVRDGEVADSDALAEALRELFKQSGLGKRVRVGIANQRTVLRTLELPPVTDRKELAAAVQFQAQEQVPMPLSNAVLDFQALGVVETPQGPRQRAVLVAAQRDMVERLIEAIRQAGLTPVGVDLSAFALIRSLYRREPEPSEETSRVLYLNVDGLTNLAIAEGTTCRFTRVVGGGVESMATEVAERSEITLAQARAKLAAADLTGPAPTAEDEELGIGAEWDENGAEGSPAEVHEPHGAEYEHAFGVEPQPESAKTAEHDLWAVLENGIRDIYGEVRNSLDFHRSQDGGGEVSHVVLSGAAQDIPGFADQLQAALGVEVRSEELAFSATPPAGISPHRLAVAAGLATLEVAQ
jgi:type IV pilus assembly protein PilM